MQFLHKPADVTLLTMKRVSFKQQVFQSGLLLHEALGSIITKETRQDEISTEIKNTNWTKAVRNSMDQPGGREREDQTKTDETHVGEKIRAMKKVKNKMNTGL